MSGTQGGPVVVAVDAMGGDDGLAVMLAGVARARRRFEGMRFFLVGDEANIRRVAEAEVDHREGVAAIFDQADRGIAAGGGVVDGDDGDGQ